jgi:hypothetical protein
MQVKRFVVNLLWLPYASVKDAQALPLTCPHSRWVRQLSKWLESKLTRAPPLWIPLVGSRIRWGGGRASIKRRREGGEEGGGGG